MFLCSACAQTQHSTAQHIESNTSAPNTFSALWSCYNKNVQNCIQVTYTHRCVANAHCDFRLSATQGSRASFTSNCRSGTLFLAHLLFEHLKKEIINYRIGWCAKNHADAIHCSFFLPMFSPPNGTCVSQTVFVTVSHTDLVQSVQKLYQ